MDPNRDRLEVQLKGQEVDKPLHPPVRNGIQVMPKEFIESPRPNLTNHRESRSLPRKNLDRLETPDVDKILPDVHYVVHEYYSPPTRVIFILGNETAIL